jgi:2-keto-4-pentenoate hydratase
MSAVNPKVVEAIAKDIVEAAPFTPRSGAASLDEAYTIQDAVTDHLITQGRRKPVAGYKLAVNSRMLMDRFGVSEPASGRIFGDQLFQSPAELPASAFRQFAYEPEIAAIMATGLPVSGAPYTEEQVATAIDRFVPAFELLDLRGSELPKIGLAEAVAQNITNAGIVIGGPGIAPSELDPAAIETTVEIDGRPELSVKGAAPQHPLEAVTWLANHLARRGLSLEAGHVVLCGTHAPIRPVEGTARIELRMSGLGQASITLT